MALYAKRQAAPGFAFGPDTPWQAEMEDAFGFTETVDQLTAITEVKSDMEKPVPMDRVICGDVGYGKTEIAVRAAFKAVQDGKQVAVLVPTTLLADQHLQTFTARMAGFPVTVKGLSRFTDTAESRKVLAGMKDGSVDIVIGTHRLLQTGVHVEGPRPGRGRRGAAVRRRAQGAHQVDAHPRRRADHERHADPADAGDEPGRHPGDVDDPHPARGALPGADLRRAARRQADRRGAAPRAAARRAGVLHPQPGPHPSTPPRPRSGRWCPRRRVVVAHGQMPEEALERTVEGFWNREYDILVCTTIVETGLDISNANTLIVERADTFGLSQLHQLRGRVGRSRERGYAYFLYPPEVPLTETAYDRLATIAQNNELGAGMAVAMKDLEIRGAGNVLGAEQSGHVAGVGFDLYVRLVGEAVEAYRAVADGKPLPPLRNRRTSASTCRSTRICRPTTSAATGCGWRATAGWPPRRTTPRSPRSSRNSSTGTGRCPSPPSGWWRWRGCGCCAASTASPRSTPASGSTIRVTPLTLLDSQQLRLKRMYPSATLPGDHVDHQVPIPRAGTGIGAPRVRDARIGARGGGFAAWRWMESRRRRLI